MTIHNNTQQYTTIHNNIQQHIGKMNPAKLLPLLTFGLLFVAFALASNANSTNDKNSTNISNTYCDNTTDAETCDAVVNMLKAKREMSDAPTLLMYLAIAAIIVIPQIQQLDV
jgi:hypothetical protein